MAPCPSDGDLRRYLTRDRSLAPQLVGRIESHVERCEPCQGRLDRLGDDGSGTWRRALNGRRAEPLTASGIRLLGWIKKSVPKELEEAWGPGGALEGLARVLARRAGRPGGTGARAEEIDERARGLDLRGRQLYERGRCDEAGRLFRKALVLRAANLPAGHPSVALSLNRLATVYARLGRYAEAEPLYRQALAIRSEGLPPGHPAVARSLLGLASIYARQGRYNEGASHYQRALGSLPPGHPDVAFALKGLAKIYRRQGRDSEAASLASRARSPHDATPTEPDSPEGSRGRD